MGFQGSERKKDEPRSAASVALSLGHDKSSRTIILSAVLTLALPAPARAMAADGWGASWSFGPVEPTNQQSHHLYQDDDGTGRLPISVWSRRVWARCSSGLASPTPRATSSRPPWMLAGQRLATAAPMPASGAWKRRSSAASASATVRPLPSTLTTTSLSSTSWGRTTTLDPDSDIPEAGEGGVDADEHQRAHAGWWLRLRHGGRRRFVHRGHPYYLCTEILLAAADPAFGATGVGGVGANYGATGTGSGIGTAKNLHTPDNGLTWLVDLITLPAMNPQGTQTGVPTYSCSGSGGTSGTGGAPVRVEWQPRVARERVAHRAPAEWQPRVAHQTPAGGRLPAEQARAAHPTQALAALWQQAEDRTWAAPQPRADSTVWRKSDDRRTAQHRRQRERCNGRNSQHRWPCRKRWHQWCHGKHRRQDRH